MSLTAKDKINYSLELPTKIAQKTYSLLNLTSLRSINNVRKTGLINWSRSGTVKVTLERPV